MNNLIRTLVFNKEISLTVADTTEIVNEAIRLHKLSPSTAKVLGRALSAMVYMSACLKEERGEISLSVKGDGACPTLGISGNRALRIRGYIENPHSTEPEEACWGDNGALTIIRDDGYNRPFVGTCELLSGSVDASFEQYYAISEQLPTRLETEVELDENGNCRFAGIVALQALPFASSDSLQSVVETDAEAILQDLKNKGVEECIKAHFQADDEVWEARFASYKCNCSKAYLSRVLVSLGEEELRKIIEEDGSVKVHCHYCSKDYEFTSEDADKLFPRG